MTSAYYGHNIFTYIIVGLPMTQPRFHWSCHHKSTT